jgi:hypothetical protein
LSMVIRKGALSTLILKNLESKCFGASAFFVQELV